MKLHIFLISSLQRNERLHSRFDHFNTPNLSLVSTKHEYTWIANGVESRPLASISSFVSDCQRHSCSTLPVVQEMTVV
jgi:hypothetical protein